MVGLAVGFCHNLTVAKAGIVGCAEGKLRIYPLSGHDPEVAVLRSDRLLAVVLLSRVGVGEFLGRAGLLVGLHRFNAVVGIGQINSHIVDVEREVGDADAVVDHAWSYLLAFKQIVGIFRTVDCKTFRSLCCHHCKSGCSKRHGE